MELAKPGGPRRKDSHENSHVISPGRHRPTVFIAHPSDLLTDHLPNGDGLVAYGFIKELARRGYRLHVATRATAFKEALPSNVKLYSIPNRFGAPPLDRLAYMRSIRQLLRRLRRTERIDLVHQMNPVFSGLSLGLLGSGLPVVLGTFVGRWPDGEVGDAGRSWLSHSKRGVARWLINLVQQSHAASLMITTPAALEQISALPLVRHKIATVSHGIDEKLFCPGPPRDEGVNEPLSILFYSHLDRRKGIFVLLEAFPEVLRQVPGCRLVMVGRGEHVAELTRSIAASGCAEQIELREAVARHDAPDLMRAHTVYCLPSYGEPFGMTVLEAMACARPVVVTSAGGPLHLVPDAGGLRVPPGDAVALAAALIKILRSPDLQRSMGAANRAHVERHHTWSHVVDSLEDVYSRVSAPRAVGVPGE